MNKQNISRIFIKYALPTIVGMMIVSLQSIIDGMFVSKGVGPQGLAAINLVMPLVSVLFSISIMIASGGVVIGGIALGEGDEHKVRGYTTLTLVIQLVAFLLVSSVMLLGLEDICYALGCDDALFPYVYDYLWIIAVGAFFFVSPSFAEAFVRLRDKPEWVFVSGLTSCLLNVLLDWWFVLGLGWGMQGAAIATVIANFIAAILLASQIKFGRIVGSISDVYRILFNGSSEMITSIAAAVTTYIFNIILMRHIGYMGVAALTIVYYLNMIVNYSTLGMSQAMYPLVAYQVGARNFEGVNTLLRIALKYSFIVGLSVYLLVLLFKGPIIAIFSNGNEELASLTQDAATYMTIGYLCSFVNIIGSGFHTAIERPIESAVIAILKSFVFVVIPLMTLPVFFQLIDLDYNTGIWLSVPIGEMCCLAVTIPLLKHSLRQLRTRIGTDS